MIRPVTLVCAALAAGSGLYLYQAKHRAQMLDREIGRTLKQIEVVKQRTAVLNSEWWTLNDPEILRKLSTQHLALQSLLPTQYVALADLPSRIPAPVARVVPAVPMDDEAVVATAAPAMGTGVMAAAGRASGRVVPGAVVVAGAADGLRGGTAGDAAGVSAGRVQAGAGRAEGAVRAGTGEGAVAQVAAGRAIAAAVPGAAAAAGTRTAVASVVPPAAAGATVAARAVPAAQATGTVRVADGARGSETARPPSARAEPARAELARAEPGHADTGRTETGRVETGRLETARTEGHAARAVTAAPALPTPTPGGTATGVPGGRGPVRMTEREAPRLSAPVVSVGASPIAAPPVSAIGASVAQRMREQARADTVMPAPLATVAPAPVTGSMLGGQRAALPAPVPYGGAAAIYR